MMGGDGAFMILFVVRFPAGAHCSVSGSSVLRMCCYLLSCCFHLFFLCIHEGGLCLRSWFSAASVSRYYLCVCIYVMVLFWPSFCFLSLVFLFFLLLRSQLWTLVFLNLLYSFFSRAVKIQLVYWICFLRLAICPLFGLSALCLPSSHSTFLLLSPAESG